MRIISYFCLLILITGTISAQGLNRHRGSIPEALLRPARGERPYYPIDTVIGELGQGEATDDAFAFADWVAGGLLSGRMNHPALENINPVMRESYLSSLGLIDPRFYRIGGGREEPDGSVSFLVRFVGREYSVVTEMYISHFIIDSEEQEQGSWMLNDLLIEQALSREQENRASRFQVDSVPYERFF